MSGSSDDTALDQSLAAYLAGEATDQEITDLEQRLRTDPVARERLGVLLRREFVIEDYCRERLPVLAPAVARRIPFPTLRLLAAAVIVLACGAVSTWALWPHGGDLPHVGGTPVVAGTPLTAGSQPLELHWSGENTQVTIEANAVVTPELGAGKRLRLQAGSLAANVAAQPADRPLVITTPQATVTVVGTQFRLTSQPDVAKGGTTRLAVTHGSVRFTDRHGSVLVHAGDKAISDAEGLWLDQAIPPDKPVTKREPSPQIAYRLEAPPTGGESLIPGDFSRYPAVRIVTERDANQVESVRAIEGGPWPKDIFGFQAWRSGSTAAGAIAPHPVDGIACFSMWTTAGLPAAQFLKWNVPLAVNTTYDLGFRYRTVGQGTIGFWLQLDELRSQAVKLPVAQQGWQWVSTTIEPNSASRRLMVSIGNRGATSADVVSIADLSLRPRR